MRKSSGGRRKPDSVEVLVGRLRDRPGPRMIIYLGRRLPGASSDLPESRDGSGRSVSGGPSGRHGEPRRPSGPIRSAPLFGLAPDGVYRARPVTRPAGELLPHRFTLTAAQPPRRPGRGGLFSVALSLSVSIRPRPRGREEERSGRWALPTIAPCGVRTFLRVSTRSRPGGRENRRIPRDSPMSLIRRKPSGRSVSLPTLGLPPG